MERRVDTTLEGGFELHEEPRLRARGDARRHAERDPPRGLDAVALDLARAPPRAYDRLVEGDLDGLDLLHVRSREEGARGSLVEEVLGRLEARGLAVALEERVSDAHDRDERRVSVLGLDDPGDGPCTAVAEQVLDADRGVVAALEDRPPLDDFAERFEERSLDGRSTARVARARHDVLPVDEELDVEHARSEERRV